MGSMKDLLGDTPYPERPGYEYSSETSKLAAESVVGSAANLRERVYGFIAQRGAHGANSDEAEVGLDLRHQTCSARFRELALKSRIEKANIRRKTRSGRFAEVFIINRA